MTKCLKEQSDTIRLACLEQAARTLIAQERALPASGNGAPPSLRAGKLVEPPKLDRLDSVVTSVAEANIPGRFVFVARDGSRWRTEETGLIFPPRLGQHLLIKRAALGSYRVTFEGERPIQARRLAP